MPPNDDRDDDAPRAENDLATRLDDARCATWTSERTRCRSVPETEGGDGRRVCERERVVRRACPGRCERGWKNARSKRLESSRIVSLARVD